MEEIRLPYRPGDLPEIDQERKDEIERWMRAAMMIGIPQDDPGARRAIEHAKYIAEALIFLHVDLEPLDSYDEAFFAREVAYLEGVDGQKSN